MEGNVQPPVPINQSSVGTATNRVSILRKYRWLWVSLLSLALFAVSLIIAFHAYIAWMLARPHIDPLVSNPKARFGASYEDVRFPSLNGSTELSGWYIPASTPLPSGKTVVFSHGYGGNREEIWVPIYDLAQAVQQQGYNVLMFDYGYVQPQAIVNGGVRESEELLGAVQYAKERGADQVFVWGFSMGAGTALQAALHDEQLIDAMILDSTFILEPATLYHNMKQVANLPSISQPLVHFFFPIINGISFNQIPYQTVKETQYRMPIFFIHGKMDQKAPYEIAQDIYNRQAADSGSQLWLLPNDGHELIYRAHKDAYLQMTTGFLRTYSNN